MTSRRTSKVAQKRDGWDDPPVDVTRLIREHRAELSPAERRVADAVLADAELVAFGTVAELAARAGTSGATVVRLAARLGLDGYGDLQERVQADLTRHLRQATERIRRPAAGDLLGRTASEAAEAVQGALDRIDRAAFDAAVGRLARAARVFIAVSEASTGIGLQATAELGMLRAGVVQVLGNPVATHRTLADVQPDDVLLVLDLPRYDRWLLEVIDRGVDRGARVVALTDSELSPVAARAELVFTVGATGTGPFDSHVPALALLEALVAGVAAALRGSATGHLDRIEAAWESGGVLDEG
ncbi:MAG: hypothetical protein JWM05_1947 [Acidimicrobiales bacterium]|nr:hypothetical protein [Acidimicrobiales bacterium]